MVQVSRIPVAKNAYLKTFGVRVFSSLLFLFFFVFPRGVFAQNVVINEFSPASSPEWVELYNPTTGEISLDGFIIYFHSSTDTTQKKVFCTNYKIAPVSFLLIETTGFLNNDGDTIILKQGDDLVDTISYGPGQILPKINSSQSAKRDPDGSSNWIVSNSPSRDGEVLSFDCPTPTPNPTPTLTPTPTPEPNQSSQGKPKAFLEIKEARDQDDNILSGSLKIYIDGAYTGNYAPENYIFCDDCKCGTNNVACGFGSHTIKVEKTGYLDWIKTLNISSGNTYEETPILSLKTQPPTSTPKLSATPKVSPSPPPSSSPQSENIINSSESAFAFNSPSQPRVLGLGSEDKDENKDSQNKDPYFNFAAIFFIIAGISFLSAAGYAYFKSKKKGKAKSEKSENIESEETS